MSSEEIYFAQHLASNDLRVRTKALNRLRKWMLLRSQKEEAEFSFDGMMKLWKGLFYCMWMADKPLVQQELADNIGSLIHAFAKPSQSYHFIGTFFKTMRRNHDHIDKFRIDKFLMLTRRFFRASLQFLKARDWECKHVQKYLSTLRESVLSPKQDSREAALGFRLHFLDIFLEELARAGNGQLPRKRAHNFLEPFYEVLTYCKSPTLVEGVRDKVFLELVKLHAGALQEEPDEDEEINGRNFIDDEAEEYNGFVDEEDELENENGDIAEQQIKEIEAKGKSRNFGCSSQADGDDTAESDEIELNLLPVDFDMSAVKASLLEFSRVEGIRAINRKAIESIVKKIIDLENGVNPFAVQSEDSGSDIELTEEELKMAEKRLCLLQKQCAEEAENCLIPERDHLNDKDDEDFEMEGGEEDLQEFEKAFVDDNSVPENRKPANGKARKKSKKVRVSAGDHLLDSDDEHISEIEKEIHDMDFHEAQKSRKRKVSNLESEIKPNSSKCHRRKARKKNHTANFKNKASNLKQKPFSKKLLR
ncbi:ribosomal RNA processing protein 1 homolog A-like isoform X1 [Varroa jacobsoni]|uniref:ribosomal RNA processing protein 1 homolog A-like isoform X1 n=1 Tax=Varroa jacobsoni TaxID=62625 RepID=UPI000BF4EE08|nr:ribosomal RNA processing protein 1 homolog A-like isoform X1 [Varroa jacobsoni]